MSNLNKIFSYQFDANVTIQQTIQIINPDYTPEQIIDGLTRGTMLTTIGYDKNSFGGEHVILTKGNENGGIDEVPIAKIIQQDATSASCEYVDFRVVLED